MIPVKCYSPIRMPALAAVCLHLLSPAFCRANDAWETLNVFQLHSHNGNQAKSIVAGKSGELFVAGYSSGSGVGITQLVRRSLDGGATWQTVFTLDQPAGGNPSLRPRLAVDPLGQIFFALSYGQYETLRWLVYKSADAGNSWTQVDDAYGPGMAAGAAAVTSDAVGRIYVAGFGGPTGWGVVRRSTDGGQSWTTMAPLGAGVDPWSITTIGEDVFVGARDYLGGYMRSLVLRSRDQGETWETADGYQLANGSSETEGLAADSRGYLYAISFGTDSSYLQHWQVRRSTDGGDAWATVDDYTGNGGGAPFAVTTDPAGRVLVVGSNGRWVVRSSSDAGTNWVTSDDFQLTPESSAQALAACSDAAGNVFAVGYNNLGGVGSSWVVRKLAASRPALAVSLSASQLKLSWPTNATSFILQSATTLANGGDWQDSSLKATVVGDQNMVTVDTTAPASFFRLHKP
jgi:hypothetical protein